MKFFASSIKAKIILLQFVLGLLVFSSLVYFNMSSVKNMVYTDTKQMGTEIVKNGAANISQMFEIRHSELNTIGINKVFNSSNLQEKANYLGQFMLNKELSKNYEMLLTADKSGNCISNDGKKTANVNIKDRLYFKEIMSGKDFVISDPVISKISNKLVVVVAIAIKSSGKTVGLIAGTVLCDNFSNMVRNINIGTGYSYIVQQDGLVIAHPDKSMVRQLNIANKNYYLDSDKTDKLKYIPTDSMVTVGKKIIAGNYGIDRYTWQNTTKVVIYQKISNTNWRLVLTAPESEMYSAINKLTLNNILIFMLALILFVLASFFMISKLMNPLIKITSALKVFSKGDLSQVTPKYLAMSKNEIGVMANSLIDMQSSLKSIIGTILSSTNKLKKSSMDLINVADTMALTSEETCVKTNKVSNTIEKITSDISETTGVLTNISNDITSIAAAVEESTATIENLAQAAEQTAKGVEEASQLVGHISYSINNVSSSASGVATSVNNVATAIKEISYSLNEISKNCVRSIQITNNANDNAQETNMVITKLKVSSKQIGKIVNVINDIADQTNMLALNAAIEAAGAGEAGKGFSVVANEVKELAKQTAEATDEIGQQIETMQSDMSVAVKAVELFLNIIEEMTTITNTIAASVAQQTATVGVISGSVLSAADDINNISSDISSIATNSQDASMSVNMASKGVDGIAKSAAELSLASNEISKNTENVCFRVEKIVTTTQMISTGASEITTHIEEINNDSKNAVTATNGTSMSAKMLSELAHELEMLVNQFKI